MCYTSCRLEEKNKSERAIFCLFDVVLLTLCPTAHSVPSFALFKAHRSLFCRRHCRCCKKAYVQRPKFPSKAPPSSDPSRHTIPPLIRSFFFHQLPPQNRVPDFIIRLAPPPPPNNKTSHSHANRKLQSARDRSS